MSERPTKDDRTHCRTCHTPSRMGCTPKGRHAASSCGVLQFGGSNWRTSTVHSFLFYGQQDFGTSACIRTSADRIECKYQRTVPRYAHCVCETGQSLLLRMRLQCRSNRTDTFNSRHSQCCMRSSVLTAANHGTPPQARSHKEEPVCQVVYRTRELGASARESVDLELH